MLKDRTDEARLRAVPTTLSLAEGITEDVRMTPGYGTVAATCSPEIEATDSALPKILCAEETGDPVSDL